MTTYLKTWAHQDVMDVDSFCEYIQQMLGTPWPTWHDKKVLKAKVDDIFRRNPGMTWSSMCKVVDYMRSRRKRPARVWTVPEFFREAWAAGQLPELDPRDEEDFDLERLIGAALEVESDDYWRNRLIGSRGVEARRRSFEAWLQTSSSSL